MALDTPAPSSKRDALVVSIFLLAVTLAVFSPVLNHAFLNYDDPDFVTANPNVQQGINGRSLSWAFTSLFIYWQPLTWVSYMLDHQGWGLNPRGFHLTNLWLHAANTLLLFAALRRLTKALWPSAFVAALFALHPLHVETVAWISERKGVLSGTFWMLALWAYARYVEKPGWPRYVPVVIFFAGGLMSKSMVITLPFVFLLLDYWPLRRLQSGTPGDHGTSTTPRRTVLQLLTEKAPLLALALASGYLTVLAQRKVSAVMTLEQLSLGQRLGHALLGYLGYLRKTIWPSDLTVHYPLPETLPTWAILVAMLVVGGLSALALANARKFPWLVVGWLWFLGTLLPVSGLLQTGDQALADRYSYLPLIGLFIAVTWTVAELFRGATHPRMLLGLPAIGVVAACVVVTGMQLQHWANTRMLFAHSVAVTSRSYVAHAILANTYADAGQWAAAEKLYTQALSFKEAYTDGQFGFANTLAAQGKFAEAAPHFRRAIQLNPGLADAHNNFGFALLRQNNPTEAAAEFTAAIRINPNAARNHVGLAIAQQMLGRTDEAVATYARVVGLAPNTAAAFLGFGNFLVGQGYSAQALPCYQQALKLEPNSVEALSRLAWTYATHQDAAVRHGAEALRLATQACALTQEKDAVSLNALAAAYAENGQFPKAIEAAQKALALAQSSGQTQIAPIVQKLIELYQAGKPYRE